MHIFTHLYGSGRVFSSFFRVVVGQSHNLLQNVTIFFTLILLKYTNPNICVCIKFLNYFFYKISSNFQKLHISAILYGNGRVFRVVVRQQLNFDRNALKFFLSYL